MPHPPYDSIVFGRQLSTFSASYLVSLACAVGEGAVGACAVGRAVASHAVDALPPEKAFGLKLRGLYREVETA